MAGRSGALPTIYDVARDAGVSPMTVSRVFTGSEQVSPEKRKAVLRSAEKLRYTPNRSAQLLAATDAARTARSRLRNQQDLPRPGGHRTVQRGRLGLAVARCFERKHVVPLQHFEECLACEGLNISNAANYLSKGALVRIEGDHAILTDRGRGVVARVTERLADIADLLAGAEKSGGDQPNIFDESPA